MVAAANGCGFEAEVVAVEGEGLTGDAVRALVGAVEGAGELAGGVADNVDDEVERAELAGVVAGDSGPLGEGEARREKKQKSGEHQSAKSTRLSGHGSAFRRIAWVRVGGWKCRPVQRT